MSTLSRWLCNWAMEEKKAVLLSGPPGNHDDLRGNVTDLKKYLIGRPWRFASNHVVYRRLCLPEEEFTLCNTFHFRLTVALLQVCPCIEDMMRRAACDQQQGPRNCQQLSVRTGSRSARQHTDISNTSWHGISSQLGFVP